MTTPVIIVKKVVKGHGGHGAAWKVAYADFVTAMMALFMVMWLLAQTDQEQQKELSEYFRTGVFSGAPSVLEGGSGLLDKGFVDVIPSTAEVGVQREAESMAAGIKKIIDSNPQLTGLKDVFNVKVTEDGMLITFSDNNAELLFDSSSADLKPPLIRILSDLAPMLVQGGYRIRIQGHTDARPFAQGSVRSNWSLSFERAEQARRVLQSAGLPEGKVVGVLAHGASLPIDTVDPNAPINRRISILALPGNFTAPAVTSRPKKKAAPPPPEAADPDEANWITPE